jgi:rhamnogalacturonyl hydrolase YesR
VIPALLLSQHNRDYNSAVHRQLTHILSSTPRFPNNAISHRDAYPSLWADFIYMVPPALAFYSVVINDFSYMQKAVQQCELYCAVLMTESGCWKHIVNVEEGNGRKKDEGLWSTSNGWAVAGISRVLATIDKSGFGGCPLGEEEQSLVEIIKGIIDGAMSLDTDSSGLLRNRLDDESWFGEAAGTALIAATVFRMAVLKPVVFGQQKYIDWALKKIDVVENCVDQETGIVAPVVNPTTDDQRTPLDGVSPEAQAFVILLFAAWRDWEAVGS